MRKTTPFYFKLRIILFTLVIIALSSSSWAFLTEVEVSQLYVSIFNRASEGEGNAYWQNQPDMATASTAMLDTDAAKNYFGSSLNSDQAFIEHIYLNTLNKTLSDDPAGIAYWVGLLNTGLNRGQVVSSLVNVINDYAPEGPSHNPDDLVTIAAYNQFTNRVFVSEYMAALVYSPPADWATATSFDGGLDVTDEFGTVLDAIDAIDAIGAIGTDSQTADLQDHLTNFNTAMDWVANDLPTMMETVAQLNTAIDADDGSPERTSEIGLLVDLFALDVANFVFDVDVMDMAEGEIQKITNSETRLTYGVDLMIKGFNDDDVMDMAEGEIKKITNSEPRLTSGVILGLVGAGLLIKGYYEFGNKMKQKSAELSEARKKRDKALQGVANNDHGAEEDLSDAKKEMTDIGGDVIEELGTKVTTDIILSPINPTSLTGVILKEVAGNEVQNGLKVLSATKECEGGYDSPGCKIGVSATGQAGKAVTPDGDVTIVVGGGDTARTVIKEKIAPGTYKEVLVDPISINEATPQKIADSDNAAIGGENSPTDPGDDDPTVTPTLRLSASVSSENDTSITYSVAAAVSGITDATNVTITVENASTGSSTETISSDSTVIWTVTVLDENAYVTVRRSDTGDQQSLTLSAKTTNFDGTYEGVAVTTFEGEDNEDRICLCWDTFDLRVTVSGSTLSGDARGTLTGNQVSGVDTEYGLVFSGSINGNVLSGTWNDSESGCCAGNFSLTKQ